MFSFRAFKLVSRLDEIRGKPQLERETNPRNPLSLCPNWPDDQLRLQLNRRRFETAHDIYLFLVVSKLGAFKKIYLNAGMNRSI